jgi:hypothetical protein
MDCFSLRRRTASRKIFRLAWVRAQAWLFSQARAELAERATLDTRMHLYYTSPHATL